MKRFVAIFAVVLFTSVYFAPVVGAVVSLGGETHICAETGKICKNKKMCMKKPRGEGHAEMKDHESAAVTSHDAHKKNNEAPSHKSCKERLSCGAGADAMNMTAERIALDDSLVSIAATEPLAFGATMKLYEEYIGVSNIEASLPDRPPETT